eukprot:3065105-Amphidinium_carterae.1
MESKLRVLEAVRQSWTALRNTDEVWKSDREVVLAAVQHAGQALHFAAETLKGDREIVLTAVQTCGFALNYATEALRADREVAQAAVQQNADALRCVADEMLEDPSFAPEAKSNFYLLKLTMLSGRSTVVVANGHWQVDDVLDRCGNRLGLADEGATIELCHGSDKVPDTEVYNFPGVQPLGEISEYQLLVRR